MALSSTTLQLLTHAAQGWFRAAAADPFATFQEGYAKTLWVNQLLARRAIILESSNNHRKIWSLQQVKGSLQFNHILKPSHLPVTKGYKPDLRVMVGGQIVQVELKARARFGSLAQAGHRGIHADLDVIAQGIHDIFFLATENDRYDAMLGDPKLNHVCPPRAALGTVRAPKTFTSLNWGKQKVSALTMHGRCGISGAQRVLVGYYLPLTTSIP